MNWPHDTSRVLDMGMVMGHEIHDDDDEHETPRRQAEDHFLNDLHIFIVRFFDTRLVILSE